MVLAITKTSWIDSLAQLLTVCIVFILVVFLAYYSSRIIARLQAKSYKNSNVKIIETVRIANNKYIEIIEIGSKCFAIAVGKEEVTFLTELQPDELVHISELNQQGNLFGKKMDFQDVLKKLKKNDSEHSK